MFDDDNLNGEFLIFICVLEFELEEDYICVFLIIVDILGFGDDIDNEVR